MTTHPGKAGASRMERILDGLIRGGVLLLVVLAPLPFGSVQPWAYSALELGVALLGLLFLYRVFLFPSTPVRFSPLLLGPVGIVLLMAVQLVPLPQGALRALSPSTADFYARTVPGYAETTRDIFRMDEAVLGGEAASPGSRPLSQVPSATRSYLLKGTAFTLALFLILNVFRESRQARRLLFALVAVGTFEAFYGTLEYLSGHQHIFGYQKRYYLEAATGTFINRNHFALFLEMSLLAALGLLFSGLRHVPAGTPWRARLAGLTDRRASINLTLLLASGMLGIAIILSYSRAGIVLGLGAAAIFCLQQLRQGGSLKKTLLAAVVAAAVFLPAYGIGYWTLTGRYALVTEDLLAPGGRLDVWKKTVNIARDFPVLGSGMGTFRYVFPRYRDPETLLFYDYTHNDYLQLLSESGVVGALFLAIAMGWLARAWARRTSRRGRDYPLLFGCGFGILAVTLHESVDFGLQIPANMLGLMVLAGCIAILGREDGRAASPGAAHG